VLLVLLLAGCSLPLPTGVKTAEGLPAEQQRSGEVLRVLPPGPKPGQSPKDVVQGFLQAQANADDSHAIARSFLTPSLARSWDDTAGVEVYLSASETAALLPESGAGEARVQVRARVTGVIDADGAYRARDTYATDTYSLVRVGADWRLTSVPPGLRLTPADQDRSLRPSLVYYVGLPGGTGAARLVPDRVYLPSVGNTATNLVQRLLRPPSSALQGSVADEPGLRATSVSLDGAGVVSVDLAGAAALAPSAREDLSARLVWTLRGLGSTFRGLRLLSGGQVVRVPGQGAVQDAGAWDAYDPEGLGVNPPYFFVAERRLRASAQLQLPSTTATAGEPGKDRDAIGVDAVAVTPDRTQVALLDGVAPGLVTVRTGPLRGPTYRKAVTAVGLSSPSYGGGERGLWMVRRKARVTLLPFGGTELRDVPVQGMPSGALTTLAVSRDGARIALVVAQRLYVGRIEYVGQTDSSADRLRITGLSAVARGYPVKDVAWSGGTELVLVGGAGAQRSLARVTVDGSVLEPLSTGGVQPEHVTASSAGIVFSSGPLLYSYTGRQPEPLGVGALPAYPG
jgi:hypothetical protein